MFRVVRDCKAEVMNGAYVTVTTEGGRPAEALA